LFERELNEAFSFLDGSPDELPEPVTEGIDLGFTEIADKPDSIIALVGGQIVTMRNADETQEVISNGVVLVEHNRIVAVGSVDDVVIPSEAGWWSNCYHAQCG